LFNWKDESKACIRAIGEMQVYKWERMNVGMIKRCEVYRAVGRLKVGKAPVGRMVYMWRW